MKRRAFLTTIGATGSSLLAGCSTAADDNSDPSPIYDTYVSDSLLRINFTEYRYWHKPPDVRTLDDEQISIEPTNDVLLVGKLLIDNMGEETVSAPTLDQFRLVGRNWVEFSPVTEISGVDVGDLPNQSEDQIDPGDAIVTEPHPAISPDQDDTEYVLLFDAAVPPKTDYLMKFNPKSSDAVFISAGF